MIRSPLRRLLAAAALLTLAASTFAPVAALGLGGGISNPRALSYANVVAALGFTPVNKAGDTMSGNLNFLDNLYDIGASGRPRDIITSRNISAGGNIATAGHVTWSNDTYLVREAANVIAQRNGISSQLLYGYNTYTDASNFERGQFGWTGSILRIGTDALGTGTLRRVQIMAGVQSSSAPYIELNPSGGIYAGRNGSGDASLLQISSNSMTNTAILAARLTPTISQASGTYTVLDINPTETTIGAGPHYLIRGRIGGGADVFNITNTGGLTLNGGATIAGSIITNNSLLGNGDVTANITGRILFGSRGGFRASADGIFELRDNAATSGGVLHLLKRADPAAPAANNAYFYMRDNGGGKMQFVARFPTGAIQVVATEP